MATEPFALDAGGERGRRPRAVVAVIVVGVLLALLERELAGHTHNVTLAALVTWAPALIKSLWVNVEISLLAVALGTLTGLALGPLLLSPLRIVRVPARIYVQVFRNAPLLVLIYFSTYVFPFEIALGHHTLPFPDWFKVTLGLALPASANVAEIFRGAIQSIPHAQWDAARSLAFSRAQVFRWIILPQCVKRMLPPWMNLYASITMGTALASLVGVHDLLDTAQVASNTVARADFTVLVYFTVLGLFFVYCYPIARFTRRLEKRYAFR
ncbi:MULTISPECIES: amino acid ABC transporter permease [Paraburkholderia]|jgi:polar amino acid transport system permease protein|uniref:Amino acid ABC transporter membrane protein 2, PAAT family n=1 Tax=Paraburkholderia phenazinium TaxID=60549 RepID=A0A1N6FX44_9BURK|nr:amino acid ABC transporter permease [Paraburkholderia phenazinium]SIN99823.1 amino acid ABC transporter membrane protein 2, PAAT family [Paraburkholderia phenazinium]